jgi:predicted MFS family arabinose efflux permease
VTPRTTRRTWWPGVQWQLIACLWFCYALNHADRQVVYTLFPALQKTFGYSNTILGLTGSLFLWVYGVCSPVAGIIGDRVSKTRVILGSLAGWSILTVISGCSPNGVTLLVCRAALGVAEALFFPAAYGLMAAAHGPRTRSKAMAIFATSQTVGIAVGGSLSGLVAERLHWRASFWLLGGLGLAFTLPLACFFRRLPAEFGKKNGDEPARWRRFPELLELCTVKALMAVTATATFGVYLVFTWLPTLLFDKFHIGLARAGFEASVYPQMGAVLGMVTGGIVADRFAGSLQGARFWIVLAAFACTAPCLLMLGTSTTLGISRGAGLAFGFFAACATVNQVPAAFDVVPVSLRATTVGLLNLVGVTAAGFAPFLGGLARTFFGVDRLMTFTSGLYGAIGTLVLFGFLHYSKRDYAQIRAQA